MGDRRVPGLVFAMLAPLAFQALPFALAAAPEPSAAVFDRTVAPLISRRCLACHGGREPKGGLNLSTAATTRRGGKNGPALVPGKLDESLLWERVESNEMPPKKPLSDADKATLRRWIESGASWGTDPIDPLRVSTETRAGLDWWSLQPVQRSLPPTVADLDWAKNPVDRFVLSRLESRGLKPSPGASRRALIRRLSFDLLGLPPRPEEVKTFEVDPDPLADERLVDRLLASPHYGERWARHWLDVVRYGESDGFERNAPRRTSWPYRDWVVRAINADLPFDAFCRLQIAGDVFYPDDPEALNATGFLVAGIHNTVVANNDLAMRMARQDELEDLVGSVSQSFLGLTANCARCHDHKFDPITQQDYYRLVSSLSGVQHGERERKDPAVAADLMRLEREAREVENRIEAIEEPIRESLIRAKTRGLAPSDLPPRPIAAWDFSTGTKDIAGGLEIHRVGQVVMSSEGATFDGKTAYLKSTALRRDLREKTLEAWVRLDSLAQQGGGVISIQTPGGGAFDAIVFGELERGRWMAGSEGFARTKSFGGPEETLADRRPVHVAITYREDGTITAYREGRPHGHPYRSSGLTTFVAGKAVVAFGIRHEPAGGNRMLSGVLARARVYDKALTPEEISASAALGGVLSAVELESRLGPARPEYEALRARREQLHGEISRLRDRAGRRVYAVNTKQPPVTHLLLRGQVTEPAEVISPGVPRGLATSKDRGDFGLAPDGAEAERRRRLADWISHPANPLLARVAVNRLWHHHFGVGLVETPNDFGFNGGRPSHPELLDWLAAEFVAHGQSLKHIHRLIVTSSTYRQASRPREAELKIDADNRSLWRKKPWRLEGEALRDGMLAVAGLLNSEMGGPAFTDYRETSGNGTTYFDPIDPVGSPFHRRSIYRFTPRGNNQGLLDAFDCPDTAAAAPRRNVTTTPLQALALWNDAFSLRMADAFARRVEAETPGTGTGPTPLDDRIRRAYELALQRIPKPREQRSARRLVEAHGLPTLCRALFNTNEFLTVE